MVDAQVALVSQLIDRVRIGTKLRTLVCLPQGSGRPAFVARIANLIVQELKERVLVVTSNLGDAERMAELIRSEGQDYVRFADSVEAFDGALAYGLICVVCPLSIACRGDSEEMPDRGWVVLCDGIESGYLGEESWQLRGLFPVTPWIGFTSLRSEQIPAEIRHAFGDAGDPHGALFIPFAKATSEDGNGGDPVAPQSSLPVTGEATTHVVAAESTGAISAPPRCADCGALLRLRRTPRTQEYRCERYPACKGNAQAHPDGSLAAIPGNAETRLARSQVHAVLNPLVRQAGLLIDGRRLGKGGKGARKAMNVAYRILSARMGMTRSECHVGYFDIATCKRALEACGGMTAEEIADIAMR